MTAQLLVCGAAAIVCAARISNALQVTANDRSRMSSISLNAQHGAAVAKSFEQ